MLVILSECSESKDLHLLFLFCIRTWLDRLRKNSFKSEKRQGTASVVPKTATI